MIYLIGGPGRTGKTTLAKKMLMRNNIPFLSTDIVFDMVMNVIPEFGLSYDLNNLDRPKKFKPLLMELIRSANALNAEAGDYLIEGVDVMPSYVTELSDVELRVVFLGFSDITVDQLLNTGGKKDYFRELSKDQQIQFVNDMLELSRFLKDECKKYGFTFFNLSDDYDQQLENALQYLTRD